MSDDASKKKPRDPLADLIGEDDVYGNADKGRIQWNQPTGEGAACPPDEVDPPQDSPSAAERLDAMGVSREAAAADPYGSDRAKEVLEQLYRDGHPALTADATETFLRRLALLELVLEEKGIELDEGELGRFIDRRKKDVDDATYQLSQLLFGRVASREGG